ncbi:unnamed protein product [Hydatigera taeniaeformis]|uniref:Secreted protein n=1 Tax=Hydatigena taeniaeformis TaxID=6205 RepID=A0A0R3WTA2_HYDTA|nr:unnamed protein product [Hydatigera taeniaeformis]
MRIHPAYACWSYLTLMAVLGRCSVGLDLDVEEYGLMMTKRKLKCGDDGDEGLEFGGLEGYTSTHPEWDTDGNQHQEEDSRTGADCMEKDLNEATSDLLQILPLSTRGNASATDTKPQSKSPSTDDDAVNREWENVHVPSADSLEWGKTVHPNTTQ